LNNFFSQCAERWFRAYSSLVPVLVLLTGCQSWSIPHGFTKTQIAALESVGFERVGNINAMEFDVTDRVLFTTGKATLGPDARRAIERIGHVLIEMHVEHIGIDGYTDSEGGIDYNQQLSMRRARAVAEVLLDIGVPAQDIRVHGYGKTRPVADNGTIDGRRQNRRVAVVVSSD
jgi:outer membrane protein OmpA-like peptidoglycan-associated protein